MEKTFENDYFTFEVEPSKSVFLYTWKPTSKNLNSSIEDFLGVATDIVNGIIDSKCDCIIGDDTNFFVDVPPETQELMNKEMLQRFNGKIEKFIHIYSKEMMNQLVVEQIFEENKEATYTDTWVNTREEALELAMA